MRSGTPFKWLAFLALACEPEPWEDYWSTTERYCAAPDEFLADKIIACIAAANPKSDEEPEDWLRECDRIMRRALCRERIMVRRKSGRPYIACEDAAGDLRNYCLEIGWRPGA
jgi:hypothetical protein